MVFSDNLVHYLLFGFLDLKGSLLPSGFLADNGSLRGRGFLLYNGSLSDLGFLGTVDIILY